MTKIIGTACPHLPWQDRPANWHRPIWRDTGNPIINQSEVYSGMYGRVNVTFYPYVFGGKKGIGCGLGPVQKLRDGEALSGGHVSAAQAFGAPQPQVYAQPQAAGVNPITGLPY